MIISTDEYHSAQKRTEEAESLKQQGNALYAEGKLEEAQVRWSYKKRFWKNLFQYITATNAAAHRGGRLLAAPAQQHSINILVWRCKFGFCGHMEVCVRALLRAHAGQVWRGAGCCAAVGAATRCVLCESCGGGAEAAAGAALLS